jgi:glycosyltransferase involved in cell wall biosynthesis
MALVSIVVSFYNEEKSIPFLLDAVRNVLTKEKHEWEIIFVDDASTDHSRDLIIEAAGKEKKGNIRMLEMSRRFGVEECFIAGVEASKGDAIILMYADLQDPPEVISQMIAQWEKGADVVHGVRRRRIGENKFKEIAAFIAYRVIGKLSQVNIPVDSGDFKLISRRVAQHLINLPESDPYLRGLIPWIGYKQTNVDYDLQPRKAGKSKVSLFGVKAWTVFFAGVTSFSNFPIPLIMMSGLAGSAIGILLLFYSIIKGMLFSSIFWLGLILILWAKIMLVLGFLGIYIIRIYKDVRGRPRYIIKDKF